MKLSIMTKNGQLAPVPSGGYNAELLAQVAALEAKVTAFESTHGDAENYGTVKLTSATDVTEGAGLAVPASELNASIEGTAANKISLKQDYITLEHGNMELISEKCNIISNVFYKYGHIAWYRVHITKNGDNFPNERLVINNVPQKLFPVNNIGIVCVGSSIIGSYANRMVAGFQSGGSIYIDYYDKEDIKEIFIENIYLTNN